MSIAIPPAALLPAGLFPLLLFFALAVRFSGRRPILNGIDYKAVADPAALHRWAGNRLFLLPVCAVAAVIACCLWPAGAIAIVALFFLCLMLIAIGVAGLGNGKFASYPASRTTIRRTDTPSSARRSD